MVGLRWLKWFGITIAFPIIGSLFSSRCSFSSLALSISFLTISSNFSFYSLIIVQFSLLFFLFSSLHFFPHDLLQLLLLLFDHCSVLVALFPLWLSPFLSSRSPPTSP